MAKLKLTSEGAWSHKLELDGQDISKSVRRVSFEVGPCGTQAIVVIELLADLEVEVEAENISTIGAGA